MDLIAFLRARLDERERRIAELRQLSAEDQGFDEPWKPEGHDPALADVAAKRQIVELYAEHAEYDDPDNSYEHASGRICGLGEAVRLLALPYAEHPAYRDEWKPDTP